MPILERDPYGGTATTYTLNIEQLCNITNRLALANELRETGKITLRADELSRLKTILVGVNEL